MQIERGTQCDGGVGCRDGLGRLGLKEAVRLLKRAARKADTRSTVTEDAEVAEIYDLITEALQILNPKKPWNFAGEANEKRTNKL